MTDKKKKGLLDDETLLDIVSTIDLESITLKRKRWETKLTVRETLPQSYRTYRVILELDEKPYRDRIGDLQTSFESSLFATQAKERKAHKKQMDELENQLETLADECERIEFIATVRELKYKDAHTTLLMLIPDDVVEPFNRQKTRLELYKVTLRPILTTVQKD